MRECKWHKEGDCWIDCSEVIYPCIAKGNLDECPINDSQGRPIKDSDYCVIKKEGKSG